jgi:hypothetical protein
VREHESERERQREVEREEGEKRYEREKGKREERGQRREGESVQPRLSRAIPVNLPPYGSSQSAAWDRGLDIQRT